MDYLYAQINIKPDTSSEAVAAELTGVLTAGLYERLKKTPDLIQRKHDPASGLDACSVKLIFVKRYIGSLALGFHIFKHPPGTHPEDAWGEEARNLNCPSCSGSGHVDDVFIKTEGNELTSAPYS